MLDYYYYYYYCILIACITEENSRINSISRMVVHMCGP
jgi:hypothetical protein